MGGVFPQSYFEALEHFARGFFHRGRIPTTHYLNDIRFKYVEWSKFWPLYFPKQRPIGFLRQCGLVSNESTECASVGLCWRGSAPVWASRNTVAIWSAAKSCSASADCLLSESPVWDSRDSPVWESNIPSGIYAVASAGQREQE